MAFQINPAIDIALILFPILYLRFIEGKKAPIGCFGLADACTGRQNIAAANAEQAVLAAKILFSMLAVALLLGLTFAGLGFDDSEKVRSVSAMLATSGLPVLAYFMVVRIFAEEFFFRAFLVPRIGIICSSALFGISHIGYGSVAEIIGAAVLGAVLAYFYKNERKLVPNYVAHFLYNAIILLAAVSI
ncbi:CAAX protease self-immunity [uncultured archaeon]|nr:CAAX protease self-immunity [uncultured archaeon]